MYLLCVIWYFLKIVCESLGRKLLKVSEGSPMEPFEICRDAVYAGDFLLQIEHNLPKEIETSLRNLLTSKTPSHQAYLTNNPKIWSYLITLHTKMALKDSELVDECIGILEKALTSDEDDLKYHAIRCMQDVCEM